MQFTTYKDYYPAIDPAEYERQQNIVLQLREKHDRELYESGIIARTLGSTAISSAHPWRDRFTEGTVLFPFRLVFPYLPDKEPPLGSKDYTPVPYFNENGEVFPILCLGRVDKTNNGYQTSLLYAGTYFDPSGIYVRDSDVPEPRKEFGFIEEDMNLMNGQLDEVASVKKSEGIDIISPFTLTEDL